MTSFSGLVAPDLVESLLGQPNIVLVDIRLAADGGLAGYEQGHVPGAVFSDYAADGWRQRVGLVPGLLPAEDHLSALFARLGISPDSRVVLIPLGVSANDFAAAARAAWTLRLAGHDQVAILDGGTKGWIKAGKRIETGTVMPVPLAPYPIRWRTGLRTLATDVVAAMDAGQAMVDARSRAYFTGAEKAPEARLGGHIPGAASLDYTSLFDIATGRLRPPEQLGAAFPPVAKGPVIHYCNTGHTAALNWFVLSEILGQEASLYDGSMTEWTQDPARPVETV
jgi:thiosulfate/3-mercaptopyruvate sulfurtransferase